ncbi:MAG: ABC transporter substrate-binding protein [Methanomethylophilus sp.]
MNKTTISTIVIIAVLLIGQGAIIAYDSSLEGNDDTGTAYSLLARVNTEGSGVYINSDVLYERGGASAFYTVESDGSYSVSTANAAAWEGLVMGTPGPTSIQHIQMQSLVQSMGLTFSIYAANSNTSAGCGCVYYDSSVTSASIAEASTQIQGGIVWEPQYSKIVNDDNGFTGLARTNDLFPNHTCCVLAGASDYVNSNADTVEQFLAGYVKSVEWVQAALAAGQVDPQNADYQKLVSICVERVAGIDEATIKDALNNITYTYCDADGTLTSLKNDIAELTENLSMLGSLKNPLSSLGFSSEEEIAAAQFADTFVDDSYLNYVVNHEIPTSAVTTATVYVAVIAGDIHQIALHVGVALGFFEDYGINVHLVSCTNGAGVAVALQNGEAQLGLLGAPPATITTINSKLITQ